MTQTFRFVSPLRAAAATAFALACLTPAAGAQDNQPVADPDAVVVVGRARFTVLTSAARAPRVGGGRCVRGPAVARLRQPPAAGAHVLDADRARLDRHRHRQAPAAVSSRRHRRVRAGQPVDPADGRRPDGHVAPRPGRHGQPARHDAHARRREGRDVARARPRLARRLGGRGRQHAPPLRRLRLAVGAEPAREARAGLVFLRLRPRLPRRARRLREGGGPNPRAAPLRVRDLVVALLELHRRRADGPRAAVREPRRAARRARHRHGLAPDVRHQVVGEQEGPVRAHAGMDRLHVEQDPLPRSGGVPRLVRGARPEDDAEHPPGVRRAAVRGRVSRDGARDGDRPGHEALRAVRHHEQEVRRELPESPVPSARAAGRRLLLARLAAGEDHEGGGREPDLVAQLRPHVGHGAARHPAAHLPPLGRPRQPPLRDRLLGRHRVGVGVAGLPALLHGDGRQRGLRLLEPRHRRPHAGRRLARALHALDPVRRVQPDPADAHDQEPGRRAPPLGVPGALRDSHAERLPAALRARPVPLHRRARDLRHRRRVPPAALLRLSGGGRGVHVDRTSTSSATACSSRPSRRPSTRHVARDRVDLAAAGRVDRVVHGRDARGPRARRAALRHRRDPRLREGGRHRADGAEDARHAREARRPADRDDRPGAVGRHARLRGRGRHARLQEGRLQVDARPPRRGGGRHLPHHDRSGRRARTPAC